jgi:hypothetical protein
MNVGLVSRIVRDDILKRIADLFVCDALTKRFAQTVADFVFLLCCEFGLKFVQTLLFHLLYHVTNIHFLFAQHGLAILFIVLAQCCQVFVNESLHGLGFTDG